MVIQERFCSFTIAKLLKEKGFVEDCRDCYDWRGNFHLNTSSSNGSVKKIAAPTLQMAMEWLREQHNIFIEIRYGDVGSPREPEIQWWWELENKQGEFLDGNIADGNTTYEEASEAAIKYCLENLI